MAKRSRGSVRPGQRRRLDRAGRPASTPRPASPDAATTSSAPATNDLEIAAIGASDAGFDEVAPAPSRRTPSPKPGATAAAAATTRRPPSGGLSVQYAHEYDYVARDLKRIFILAVVLLVILGVIYVIVEMRGAAGI